MDAAAVDACSIAGRLPLPRFGPFLSLGPFRSLVGPF